MEQTKICSNCKIEKPISKFYKSKIQRFGVRSICIKCGKALTKAWQIANIEKVKVSRKAYYKKNKEIMDKKNKKWRANNIEKAKEAEKEYYKKNAKKIKARAAAWQKENPEKRKVTCKKWVDKNPEKERERHKKWRKKNPEKDREKTLRWQKKNKEHLREYCSKRNKEKRITDPKFKLNEAMSSGIRESLRGNKKGAHWEDLVGYTIEMLKKHLEKQFVNGMTWKKFLNGEIHIDHKIPKSVFNYTEPTHTDFKRCWALKNLQPLWAKENMSKGAKLDKHFQPSLQI